MSYLNKFLSVSILSCIALSVMADPLPPSTEARCVCMPGNATGVLLKPGAMGVSSGAIESCPCVPKSKPETKESDSADGSTGEKTPGTSEGNTENTTSESTSTNPGTVPDASGNSSSEPNVQSK